mmetsp:Transcript_38262/g.103638  ORF Transcript_38262/g.103638 Transcript_38262/m.103638 type:complete len:258 (-) Transcript_38262:331-1104(-)
MADLPHDVWADLHVVIEEGVHGEHRGVHLVVQLYPQGLRHEVQEPQRLLRHGPLLRVHDVLRVPLRSHGQAPGDAVLREVAPQHAELLRLLAPDNEEVGHVRRQDTQEHSARPEGDDEDDCSKEVLPEVVGDHLIHASCKLREGPPEAHQVPVGEILLAPRQLAGPGFGVDPRVPGRAALAHGPPEARDEVAHAQHRDDELEDVAEHDHDVGGQPLHEHVDDLAHSRQAQEPNHADDAEGARRLAHAGHARACCVHH